MAEATMIKRLSSPEFQGLVQEVLDRGVRFRFRARGRSMYPFILSGDTLLVEAVDPARVSPGDVVLFCQPDNNPIVHRVVERMANGGQVILITRGDNLVHEDQPIKGEWVLGRVVEVERQGRCLRLDRGPGRLLNRSACYLQGWSPWRFTAVRKLGRLPWRCLARLLWRRA